MSCSAIVVATTERTTISEICLADAPFMFDLVRTPGWLKYIGDRKLEDVAEAEEHLANGFLKSRSEHGFGYYLVRNKQGASIGVVGFLRRDYLEHEDFGFAFMPAFNQRGFAYEAAEALLGYGARQFGFKVLDAVTMHTNSPSRKLLVKLGFIEAGEIVVPDNPDELLLYRWRVSGQ